MMATAPEVANRAPMGTIELVADDRESDAEVDEAGDQLLEQAAFVWPSLEDHKRVDDADKDPGERHPPQNFEE